MLFYHSDQFGYAGVHRLLLGQRVPFRRANATTSAEMQTWQRTAPATAPPPPETERPGGARSDPLARLEVGKPGMMPPGIRGSASWFRQDHRQSTSANLLPIDLHLRLSIDHAADDVHVALGC